MSYDGVRRDYGVYVEVNYYFWCHCCHFMNCCEYRNYDEVYLRIAVMINCYAKTYKCYPHLINFFGHCISKVCNFKWRLEYIYQ